MRSQQITKWVGLAALLVFVVGALTGCPLVFGGGRAGTVMFFANPTTGAAPLAVCFHGVAALAPPYQVDRWAWNFGDGATGLGRQTSHTYTAPGTYTATLTVYAAAPKFRGTLTPAPVTLTFSQEITVIVSQRPPVADAGADQSLFLDPFTVPVPVQLDGSGSYDPDDDPITYAWTVVSVPAGSTAALTGADTVNPTFTPDLKGNYVFRLIVNDGQADSEPDEVVVTVGNRPPVANAGPDQALLLPASTQGPPVTLDGSGSNDPDGDPLTYAWTFTSRPVGSEAALTGADTVTPTFMPDLRGIFIIQLIVNDGLVDSEPDTVMVVINNQPPVADAGTDQSVLLNALVTLDGSASYDLDGDPLTYNWWFVATPGGSEAVLSGADTVSPTFTPDLQGTYEIGLRVNDGISDSLPDSVTVTVDNQPPIAVNIVLPGNETEADVNRIANPDSLTPNLETLYGLPAWQMLGKAFPWGLRLMQIDPDSADFTGGTPITIILDMGDRLMPVSINAGRGLAVDPTNGEMWAIIWFNREDIWDGPYRALCTLNPRTGVAHPVGDPVAVPLSDWYTGLAVDSASVLYGVTFNQMDQPQKDVDMYHSLYEIDKTDTSETFLLQFPEPDGVDWTPGEAIAFNTDDGLMYHATGDEPELNQAKAGGAGRLFRSLDLDSLALNSITLASQAYSWYEPTAMTYAPGTGQFYIASMGDYFQPVLSRMTLDGGSATEEVIGPLEDDFYPLTMGGLAFRYDRSFDAPVVLLDGSQSSDPDGDSLTYAWSFTSVPLGSEVDDADLSDLTGATTSFTPDRFGAYVIQLVVFDGQEYSVPATVTVNYVNLAPVADAGDDQTVPEGQYYTAVQLDGSGSQDPDGDDLTFSWTWQSVPAGSTVESDTQVDLNSAAPSFYADIASATEPYVLELTVTDADGESSSDTVSISVLPAPEDAK